MTTNGWHAHGAGATKTWEASFLGFSCLVLYSPDSGRSNHNFAWAHWKSGGIHQGGHTRASLRAYCEREGITLPEEWCPVEWEEWRHERLSASQNSAMVCVRSDMTQNIRLFRDGSWSHREGAYPSGFAEHFERGTSASDYRAYAAEHGLPMPPADWWPEPEPRVTAEPYSLADDPRLREVVRTKWGEARWYEGNGNDGMHLAVDHEEGFDLASVYPDGRWIAYSGPTSADEIQRDSKATNPANAYTECMAVLRDLGSLVDEKPDPDACAPQPPSIQERLLNLSARMFLSDKPASYYAGELRDLARELDGGAK